MQSKHSRASKPDVDLDSLVRTSTGKIDVVSIESSGRFQADRISEYLNGKMGGYIKVRPSPHTAGNGQYIEWIEGTLTPGRSVILCEDLAFTGKTLKLVIQRLIDEGYSSQDIYVSFSEEGDSGNVLKMFLPNVNYLESLPKE